MNRWRVAAIVTIVFGTIGYIASSFVISTKQKMQTVTSYSDAVTGLSIFHALAARTSPYGVTASKSAFLDGDPLRGAGVVIIASPVIEVSSREAQQLRPFVEKGGLLVLSFHDNPTRGALDEVLQEFGMDSKVVEDPEFKNGAYRRIKVNGSSVIAKQGSLLAMYSAQLFDLPACGADRFSCYVKEKAVGSGDVVLINGIIPIANGLIGKEQNREIAFGITQPASGQILIDEYRHLFTEKTLGDLLTDVRVMTPLVALFLGALAFFLLGDRDERVHERLFEDAAKVPVYHDFARRVFLGSLEGKSGAAQAADFTARCVEELFSDRHDVLAGLPDLRRNPEGRLREILSRHRGLLEERGVIGAAKPAGSKI